MKGRVVALGRLRGREAAALVVDGRLEDLRVAADGDFGPGAILRGIADRPMKGQGGVFVKLPEGRKGFLRETGGVAPGRPVLVQVQGVAEEGKAVPLTRRLMFKGRLAIVTPGAPGLNLSRRIKAEEDRERLGRVAAAAMEGTDWGLVVRSAAVAAEDAAIGAEIAGLRALCCRVLGDPEGGPELLVDAPGPHETAWRDWSDPAPDAVEEGGDAFARTGAEEMVEALASPLVALPGGGSMAVEPTRALVAVDVNTGGDTSPAAGLKANIAAVRELPRQLRLRGLGGQVTVDFAPMPKKDRGSLEQQIRTAFRDEGSDIALAGWTPLGNYEMQRRRDRLPLSPVLSVRE
ncbi:MAG: ribonuclease E/G [Pseudomonadota bacterium]